MTTPGKNQSKRTPERTDDKNMEDREGVRNPSGDRQPDDLNDNDEDEDRIPEESVEDQETGRTDRDSDRTGSRDRNRG